MHERSLVRSLLRQVDQIAAEHDEADVAEVTVEVGPLSGVEVDLVKIAFEEQCGVVDLAKDPEGEESLTRSTTESTRLKVLEVPLTVRCTQCHAESDLSSFIFRCESCGSGEVQVISGDELRLISLTFAEGTTHAR
ncbi:hydrogenase maturation nickel metallochaperone HypA [Roseiconus lacunae]|uniref:hydrogenase maturation nickel metallochaperone HypA/HybF n=1 Tax=Roseiconus lacunae TaxID=2605694 RepID=UPI003087547B|nr:hydrogenase maturation nickel metallochaperone HypA [Stieleria sp. HD01]